MNGPEHLNLARRDLIASYNVEQILSDRQLAVAQAQAHATIALVCAVASAYELGAQPGFDQHVADAMNAVQLPDTVQAPDGQGPIWRCASDRHAMRCQLADGHAGDHEYTDALGSYAWTNDGPPVDVLDDPAEARMAAARAAATPAPRERQETAPLPAPVAAQDVVQAATETAELRLVPPYVTDAPGARQRGMC